jgi:hypothetical protein
MFWVDFGADTAQHSLGLFAEKTVQSPSVATTLVESCARTGEDAAIAIAAAAAAARGANFNMLWPPAMSGFIRLVADDGGVFNHLAAK